MVYKYKCVPCNYQTSLKQNFNRHCNTKKHKINTESKTCKICNKKYKGRSGLHQHITKVHTSLEYYENYNTIDTPEHDEKERKIELENKNKIDTNKQITENVKLDMDTLSNSESKDIGRLTNMVEKLINANQDLQEMVIKMANEPKIVNTIHNNKTYNIIAYLNEECGEAINMSDFLNNIDLTYNDIDRIWEEGYVDNVKKTFIGRLEKLEYNKRPIHCADKKRKQFYIKDSDKWTKEDENKVEECVNRFNTKQLKQLEKWKAENPNYKDCEKTFDTICKIQRTLLEMYKGVGLGCNRRMMGRIIRGMSKMEIRS